MNKRWLLIPLCLLAVPVFAFHTGMFPVLGARPTVEEREQYAASEAYNPEAGVFQNRRPELFAQMREKTEFLPMVRKWFSERVDGSPISLLPEKEPDLQAFLVPGSDTRVIWFGHSTFLLNVAGTIVLVDPVFSETAAPAQHFSGRDGVKNIETLWASWVLATPDTRLYFSGDSGYDTHFVDIDARLGPFDLAFHTWYAPVAALSQLADQEGIDLVTPMLGEMIMMNDSLKTTRWWERVVHADS